MKLLRIKKVDFENEYEEVAFLPPRAKPVSGPHRVGDFVEMTDHGYIRERYRLSDSRPGRSGLCPGLFS